MKSNDPLLFNEFFSKCSTIHSIINSIILIGRDGSAENTTFQSFKIDFKNLEKSALASLLILVSDN